VVKIWWRRPTPGDIFEVTLAMRESDAREVFALRRDDDRYRYAAELAGLVGCAPLSLAYGLDGFPNAAALLWLWPLDESGAFAAVNLFATADFPRLAPALVRDLRGRLGGMLLEAGYRRLECRVLETHHSARRFIRALGAVPEGICRDLGRDGEAYVLCAWRSSDWEVRRSCASSAARACRRNRPPTRNPVR
jgi:hypothetical protein